MFGIFRRTKRTSTSRKRLYLSENLCFLERTPIQSLVRKRKLCKPSLTTHIKHWWRMPFSTSGAPLGCSPSHSPIQRHCRPGVRQHHHTDFNQEGKRVQYYTISHLKECLGSEGVAHGPSQEKKQAQGPVLRLHFDPTFIVLLQHVIFGLETACD